MLRTFSTGKNWTQERKWILDQVCGNCNCSSTAATAAASRRNPTSLNHRSFASGASAQAVASTNSIPYQEGSSQLDGAHGQNPQREPVREMEREREREKEGKAKAKMDPFQALGLNPLLSSQVQSSFPHITTPTPAQAALIPAVLAPNDVLLRAHTGTGKSFALLLSLLSKPRLVFKSSSSSNSKPVNGISSILIVPTNELAHQYLQWAIRILPKNLRGKIDSVVQVLVRPDGTLFEHSKEIEMNRDYQGKEMVKSLEKLRSLPPHLLIVTPGRLKDLLDLSSSPSTSTFASSSKLDPISILNLRSIKTLAFDEGDSLLSLPGRFPSKKLSFKNASPFLKNLGHKSPTLAFLNWIMSFRPSFSGGNLIPSAGMEPGEGGRRGDERRPPEAIRRVQYQGIEKSLGFNLREDHEADFGGGGGGGGGRGRLSKGGFSIPLERLDSSSNPLQLVFVSATANSVLRHFLGSRTGWLRIGIKEFPLSSGQKNEAKRETGKWLDLTGLSGKDRNQTNLFDRMTDGRWNEIIEEAEPSSLPKELIHSCLVVDDGLQSWLKEEKKGESTQNQVQVENQHDGHDSNSTSASSSQSSQFKIPLIRNLDFKRLHRLAREEQEYYSKDTQSKSTPTTRNERSISPNRKEPKEPSERTVESSSLEEHVIDDSLLNALAFTFASDLVMNGLAVIPPRWSLLSTRKKLQDLGVEVRFVGEEEKENQNQIHQEKEQVANEGNQEGKGDSPSSTSASPKLTLIQSSSVRGLDLPDLTHVFVLGLHSVGDAVRYTHLAGRVSRIGDHSQNHEVRRTESTIEGNVGINSENPSSLDSNPSPSPNPNPDPLSRPVGKVITLIKGASEQSLSEYFESNKDDLDPASIYAHHDEPSKKRRESGRDLIPIGNDERKISLIYRRLRLSPRRFDLGLLKM